MSTSASAAATVDSATTKEAPAVTDFNGWDEHGTPIRIEPETPPTKQDSAPVKDKAAADSAPQRDKTADTASESATDKDQKPHLKTREDTEKRFKEILDENKALQRRLESLERSKTSEPRDGKQESQPAPEVKVPPLKQFLTEFFAKPENKGKDYETGVEAWQDARDAAKEKNLEQKVRSQIALESAQKELASRIESAKKTYADYDQRVQPAVEALTADQQIPFAVKALINDSPVFEHLLYVLGEPAALADLVKTAKTNPTGALRKITLTEQLVQAELAKASGKDKAGDKGGDPGGDGKTRDASGKFVSSSEKDKSSDAASETKPRAPKPPSEVGGRGTASEDALVTAAGANDFKSFEAEEWRRKRASRS